MSLPSRIDLQPIPSRDPNLPCPLSLSQERLWFMEQFVPGEPVHNEAEAARLEGKLDVGIFEQALNAVIDRHEILRTTIEVRNNLPIAVVHDRWPLKLIKIDLRQLSISERESELARLLIEHRAGRTTLRPNRGFARQSFSLPIAKMLSF